MATNLRNFPGVFTQITDSSFVTPATSRFLPGLIGVASKGPFNAPTSVTTLAEYVQIFGQPIDQAEEATPFYMSDAMGMISDFTDGVTVVRVGNQYAAMPNQGNVSGHTGAFVFSTGTNNSNFTQAMLTAGQQVYMAISEAGKVSTVNVSVDHVTGTNIFLSSASGQTALQDAYDGAATVVYSNSAAAAWTAEGALYSYNYGTSAVDFVDRPLDATVGAVVGVKGQYYFDVAFGGTNVTPGLVYKIADTSHKTTYEVRPRQIVNNRIYLETSDITRVGYQALALQDTYSAAHLYKVNTAATNAFLYLAAKNPGDWANGSGSQSGLYVQVSPGSARGTKKLSVYWNSAQVETLDNISDSANAADADSYETIIGLSQYVVLVHRDTTQKFVAANTVNPWDANYWVAFNPVGGPISMPVGAINAGIIGAASTGGQFINGFNGQNASATDVIGSYDPNTGTGTGLKAFEDVDDVTVNVLACPMDNLPIDVMQELRRVAKKINAVALADVPSGLNAASAVDWHNGHGQFQGRGRVDDPNIAVFWNWFQITDPFTGLLKYVPPTLGALRAMAFTWNRDKPWFAAAGQTRGLLPEALQVAYPRIPEAVREAMYGNGNGVNPIINYRGQIMVWGDRTMQIAESKLSAIHSVILVNYIVLGLGRLARQYVFDPNDLELLVQIRLAFTDFLDKIRNERGLEDYLLVVDETNNTPDTRNAKEVIVDLAVIPTDVAERIFINVTVNKSGAQLKSVT